MTSQSSGDGHEGNVIDHKKNTFDLPTPCPSDEGDSDVDDDESEGDDDQDDDYTKQQSTTVVQTPSTDSALSVAAQSEELPHEKYSKKANNHHKQMAAKLAKETSKDWIIYHQDSGSIDS